MNILGVVRPRSLCYGDIDPTATYHVAGDGVRMYPRWMLNQPQLQNLELRLVQNLRLRLKAVAAVVEGRPQVVESTVRVLPAAGSEVEPPHGITESAEDET